MTTETAQWILLCALSLLLVTAMVTDWRRRDIPNWLTAAAALLAPLWWWSLGLALWPDIAIQLALAAGLTRFPAGAPPPEPIDD